MYSQKTVMKVTSSVLVICSCYHFFFHKMGFIVKFSFNIYYISKSEHCSLPPPLVYELFACKNVDNCERPLRVM